jgi:hypothetical protein
VRPTAVKVLDFGLAKAIEPGSGIRDQGFGNASNLADDHVTRCNGQWA